MKRFQDDQMRPMQDTPFGSAKRYTIQVKYIFSFLFRPPKEKQDCSIPSGWNTAGAIEIENHMLRRS